MNEDKQYLSKEKFAELTKELEHLKGDKRKDVAEKLEFAKSLGDLSENAEYQEARDEQAAVEDRINNVEAILKTAEIVSKSHTGNVTVGSSVVIIKEGSKDEVEYQIVGSEEADTAAKKISNKSPIGAALIGSTKGETVVAHTPNGDVSYSVVKVK